MIAIICVHCGAYIGDTGSTVCEYGLCEDCADRLLGNKQGAMSRLYIPYYYPRGLTGGTA